MATIAGSLALPLLRRRLGLGAWSTMGVMVAAPVGLVILRPRTRGRDAALFFLQMWAYLVAHELPYDDPERARRRLRVRYPIVADRALGRGVPPGIRLQRAIGRSGRVTGLDTALTWVHWLWFVEPYLALVWVLVRDEERFARAARQMAAVYDLGALVYAAIPTAPPWWAGENGHLGDEKARRVMVEVGEDFWGEEAWGRLYGFLGGNPWAAMPSIHFATALMAALLLADTGGAEGAVGWAYAGALAFALVYLGEHYLVDLIAGATLVLVVRRGERWAEPYALAASRMFQRLERFATP